MKSTETREPGAHAELRAWYLGSLRPRLAAAVTAGIVEPGAVVALDSQLAELFGLPREPRKEAA